jgi:Tol biopolymer transport system component
VKRIIALCAFGAGLVGCGEETLVPPPDCGGRFVVVYAREPAVNQADLYLYDFEGVGFHLLPGLNTANDEELDPTMTRDLRFIAFERRSPLGGGSDIILYDRCQASIVGQPGLNTASSETDPAFSGDGKKLAFVRDTLGRREVRLYDGPTDRLVPLPGTVGTGLYQDADPVMNQVASLLVFVSNRNGDSDILIYDTAGDSLLARPGLASAGEDVDPSITPDGHYLVFASDRASAGDFDLYLYDLPARQFLAVPDTLNTAMTERHPSINSSGDRIVFESNRTGGLGALDLYLYTRSTTTVAQTGASSAAIDMQPWIVWQ